MFLFIWFHDGHVLVLPVIAFNAPDQVRTDGSSLPRVVDSGITQETDSKAERHIH